MRTKWLLLLPVGPALLFLACSSSSSATKADKGFEAVLGRMPVPPGNPEAPEKVELGKLLFFDPRLSAGNQLSCSTCHQPDKGWSDGLPRNFGAKGEMGRNSTSLWNAAYEDFPSWDGAMASLEQHSAKALTGEAAMAQKVPELIGELNAVPEYRERFQKAFGEEVTLTNVIRALGAFERTILTWQSPEDRRTLGPEARRGREVFFGKGACASCHTPPLFTDNAFHVLGVPQVGPRADDPGRFAVTGDERDRGAFRTPSLRNVKLTGPYMHDGVFSTLDEVVAFYDAGGGNAATKSARIGALHLTEKERKDLVAYLEALTDPGAPFQPPKLP
jgi:cytochrome c peroxidase